MQTQQWVAVELRFTATKKVNTILDTTADVTFVCGKNSITMPAFWDGGFLWKVRFAPIQCGTWQYSVKATGEDIGLDGITGSVECVPYTGSCEIYRRGFVKTEKGKRYFMYDDGTPFFYLGDTHWNMVKEEIDSAGPCAEGIQTDSHFKYIVDARVEQGFTVYQSEPLGRKFVSEKGYFDESDMEGFHIMDRYFAYIAEKGLLHANAELLFPSEMTKELMQNLYPMTRYWVARYGAYPVLWTLGQEVDPVSFNVPDKEEITKAYIRMCGILDEIDPYHHPISAHQINTSSVGCAGGVPVAGVDGGYNEYDPADNVRTGERCNRPSSFRDAKGHSWWAAQWRPCVDQQYNFGLPKDYWENGDQKPTVDYEGRYDHLYTKGNGARIQGWIALLCGMCGTAYGGADMWVYQGHYAQHADANDGIDVVTIEEKRITWGRMIHAPISQQMTYLANFFQKTEWWKLEPDFDYGKAFCATDTGKTYYAAAHEGNRVYVVYLYRFSADSCGKLVNMDDAASYCIQWFDPWTGQYQNIEEAARPVNGTYTLPLKPQDHDMILLARKNG